VIGVISLTHSNPVTLNLFQGPSGRKRGATRTGTHPAVWLATARSGCAEKWTLKQVQGDEDFVLGGQFNHREKGENRLFGESNL
jgi:hypothetical protein